MKVAFFLGLTMLGSLVATVAAATGASPALLGGALALAFLGLAGAAAAAAIALHAPDDLTEPRVARGPSRTAPLPSDGITRPTFGWMWLGALGAFGWLLAAALGGSLADHPAAGGEPPRERCRRAQRSSLEADRATKSQSRSL